MALVDPTLANAAAFRADVAPSTVFHRPKIVAETTVGHRPAILPTVRGRAWITGFHNYVLDPTDPYPQGYLVGDTWGTTLTMDQRSPAG